MTAIKKRTETVEIIPFPGSSQSTTGRSMESLFEKLMDDYMPELEDRLKSVVEAAVFEAWVKNRLSSEDTDDPFDAVYLSELNPDEISVNEVERINRYYAINDLSDEISFNDDWED